MAGGRLGTTHLLRVTAIRSADSGMVKRLSCGLEVVETRCELEKAHGQYTSVEQSLCVSALASSVADRVDDACVKGWSRAA